MAEGRPIHGDDFIDNMQDYIEERLTDGSDVNELGAAERALEQEAADLQRLQHGGTSTPAQPNEEALAQEAHLPAGRMDVRPDPADLSIDATIDPRQQPPEAEARQRLVDGINGAPRSGSNRR